MENKPILILLIISFALLIFLLPINFASFSHSFYEREFAKYDVVKNVPEYDELHQSVINFVKGKSEFLPDSFNEREKQHLNDVRMLALFSRAAMYLLIVLFGIFLILAAGKSRKTKLREFMGNGLLFGGILALAIAAIIYLSIILDFSSSFESFHKIFFKPGTYAFDPDKEIIVNLYPEGLFMDLGLRIAKFVLVLSVICIVGGLWMRNKQKLVSIKTKRFIN